MVEHLYPKNLMEELVDSCLDEMVAETKCCCCERCRADVMALALNRLPPKYTVSIDGDVYSRYDALKAQFKVDVTSAVLHAILLVKDHPYHEKSLEKVLLPTLKPSAPPRVQKNAQKKVKNTDSAAPEA